MFRDVLLAEPDTQEGYGERRWREMGTIRGRTTRIIFIEFGIRDHSPHFVGKGTS
jgi:uncharacterized DUF497 family protein